MYLNYKLFRHIFVSFQPLFNVLLVQSESTKQMEQTLRAKVEIVFKSENLKIAYNKNRWAYWVYIRQKKSWGGCHH